MELALRTDSCRQCKPEDPRARGSSGANPPLLLVKLDILIRKNVPVPKVACPRKTIANESGFNVSIRLVNTDFLWHFLVLALFFSCVGRLEDTWLIPSFYPPHAECNIIHYKKQSRGQGRGGL